MSFPNPNKFGIVDNPLIFTPFVAGNGSDSGGGIPSDAFMLLDGTPFLLLNGEFFVLLE